ncbi:MAG: nucleoside-diphosphate kinase [Candidatus Eisenbacteria bacterium]
MERTLLMVKPDATGRNLTGEILRRVEEAGFRLRAIRMLRLRKEEAESFYAVHRDQPFFGSLVEYILSGNVVPMVLEKENAVRALRDLIGPTKPADAKKGSIRGDLGLDLQRNAVHASDAPETAAREIAFFFSGRERI